MNALLRTVKHFNRISKHKFEVFKLCCKAGIPIQGIMHDLSKFSPTEFWEGVKYYSEGKSPIFMCKKEKGYSLAWLHHKGRNKHHPEFWYDNDSEQKNAIMPYKYVVEMICDNLAAGITYQGKKWKKEYQLSFWDKKKNKILMNEKIKNMVTDVYKEVSIYGINKVINKNNLKQKYSQYVENK